MSKKLVYKRPPASSTTWSRRFHNNNVEVFASDEYRDYFKVVVKGSRPKYFFGESAWMDAQRLAVDNSHYSEYSSISDSI